MQELRAEEVDAKYNKVTLLGSIMLFGVAVMLGAVLSMMAITSGPQSLATNEGSMPAARLVFLGAVLLDTGALALFKLKLVPNGVARALAASSQAGDASDGPAAPGPQPLRVFGIQLAPQQPRSQGPLDVLFSMTLAMWAICEAPIILGFVLFTMAARFADLLLFWGMGFALAAVLIPRRATWRAWIEQAQQSVLSKVGQEGGK